MQEMKQTWPNMSKTTSALKWKGAPMSILREPFFPHRRNRDGSYDSICLTCFATVGSGTHEELVKYDKEHVCEPSRVAQRGLLHALSGADATSE
jgi:hypothetical protein